MALGVHSVRARRNESAVTSLPAEIVGRMVIEGSPQPLALIWLLEALKYE